MSCWWYDAFLPLFGSYERISLCFANFQQVSLFAFPDISGEILIDTTASRLLFRDKQT